MRKFIRHPLEIPIEVRATPHVAEEGTAGTSNIGVGGLAFQSVQPIAVGSLVHIRIAYLQPTFEVDARVVWCQPLPAGADLGVEFLSADDAFRARMVEQVCHIEHYRQSIGKMEGRKLTTHEAATEWIARHAANFPG